MSIIWAFVEVLSRDMVTSAYFTSVDSRKCIKIFFAPQLARSILEVSYRKQKTVFLFQFLFPLGSKNNEKIAHFPSKFGCILPTVCVTS